MASRYKLHVAEWNDCQRCYLSKVRKNVVHARGIIPAHIVFVGEAPGESEDVVGRPFVGPAGRLLDHIISMSIGKNQDRIRYLICNLLGCIPRELGSKTGKAMEPPDACVKKCKPRLEELLDLAQPTIICCVGKAAKEYLTPGFSHSIKLPGSVRRDAIIQITHPSAILRANVAQQGLLVQRAYVEIRQVVLDIFPELMS